MFDRRTILASSAAMAMALVGGVADADEPKAQGAVVVAIDASAPEAAKELARSLYADRSLRPSIDEATARSLIGDAPRGAPENAPAADAPVTLDELAQLRASASSTESEATRRRLLAAIGAELHAALVVAVQGPSDAAPRAKILRVSDASYVGAELFAISSPGSTIAWPSAAAVVRATLPAAAAPAPAALAPSRLAASTTMANAPEERRPVWKSPWFWTAIGAVAAAGATVFVLSQVESSSDTVHLQGTVPP